MFYQFPVAHVLLYGICRDFWRLLLRGEKEILPHGDAIWLPPESRAEMTRLFSSLRVTSSFSGKPKDVTKCVMLCV